MSDVLARTYTPTLGMLRALSGAPGATDYDFSRCRLRGLLNHQQQVTPVGRFVINREIKRRQELAGG